MTLDMVITVLIPVLTYIAGYKIGRWGTYREAYKQGVEDFCLHLSEGLEMRKETREKEKDDE